MEDGLALQPRLSAVAGAQLADVHALLRGVRLLGVHDRRLMAWGEDVAFSSRAAFRVLSPHGVLDQVSIDIWGSRLPSKIKIFARLLVGDRLSTRANLYAKNCAPSSSCASCQAEETTDHLFAACPRVAPVWAGLGLGPFLSVGEILSTTPAAQVDSAAWPDGLFILLWNVWKARNNVVFNSISCGAGDVLRRAADDTLLWSNCFETGLREQLLLFRSFLLSGA